MVDRTYVAVDALLTDALVDEVVEIVTGWSGETGTDYMGVTTGIRRALTAAWTGVVDSRAAVGGSADAKTGERNDG